MKYSNPELAIRVLTELHEEIDRMSNLKKTKNKKRLHRRNTNNTTTL